MKLGRGKKRTLRRLLAVVALAALPFSAAAATHDSADLFVQHCLQRAYAILSDKSISEEQRRIQFHEFMLAAADMDRIGRFTLGAYASHAPPGEFREFQDAFAEHDIVIYSAWLSKYKGQTFTVSGWPVRGHDDEPVVKADFYNPADPNGPHSEIDFRVGRRADGRAAITDIRVEGIWLAVSERGDFTKFLDEHHGSVAALTHYIQSVARQIFSRTPQ